MHENMKLGKHPPRVDRRTLKFARYLQPGVLPPPDESCDNTRGKEEWGMLLNSDYGCCTISACGHAVQLFVLSQVNQGIAADIIMPSDDIILRYYEQWDGYNPADPSTDRGGVEIDVLNRFRKEGFAGYGLKAYVEVNPLNTEHIKQAIEYFGNVYAGVDLPLSAQTEEVWESTGDPPGSWGGHAIVLCGFDADGLTCITWGAKKKMDWKWWARYADEAYCLLSPDWRPPEGFDTGLLESDLRLVSQ